MDAAHGSAHHSSRGAVIVNGRAQLIVCETASAAVHCNPQSAACAGHGRRRGWAGWLVRLVGDFGIADPPNTGHESGRPARCYRIGRPDSLPAACLQTMAHRAVAALQRTGHRRERSGGVGHQLELSVQQPPRVQIPPVGGEFENLGGFIVLAVLQQERAQVIAPRWLV